MKRSAPTAFDLDYRRMGPIPLGPNGRRLCRECNVEVPRNRRTFCSRDCVVVFQVKCNPSFARQQVFIRDNGICSLCGKDSFAQSVMRRKSQGSGHLWQADHIVPVVEGGGACGLDNLRTLCTACHKSETAELAKRLAKRRAERTVLEHV